MQKPISTELGHHSKAHKSQKVLGWLVLANPVVVGGVDVFHEEKPALAPALLHSLELRLVLDVNLHELLDRIHEEIRVDFRTLQFESDFFQIRLFLLCGGFGDLLLFGLIFCRRKELLIFLIELHELLVLVVSRANLMLLLLVMPIQI